MKKLLNKSWLLTFIIMLCTALVFGLASYNLFFLFKANLNLVLEYGMMALLDGALIQLLLLALYGIVSLSAFLVFEACKKVLVDKLTK